MATADQRSAGNTLSIARCAIEEPSVARRSPAMTTPSANRSATTVVACRTVKAVSGGWIAGVPDFRRRLVKSGPGSSTGLKIGSATGGLLPALLYVVADELLRVVLEDLVDLVEQVVEVGLQLLAARGRWGWLLLDLGLGPRGSVAPLLLTFWHRSSPQELSRSRSSVGFSHASSSEAV